MGKGFLSIILHAHLPYVRHPEHRSLFEENWLFEAITECYVPLIGLFDRLWEEGVKFRLTLSLSPPLLAMLEDDLLKARYLRHMGRLLELCEKEIQRTRHKPSYRPLAFMYYRFFSEVLDIYQNRYGGDLLKAFKKHAEVGNLELITTAATHGFLPLLSYRESAVRAQIAVGVEAFRQALGMEPAGFWLPECGYYPGLENLLSEANIRYFFVDAHGLLQARERPRYGTYAPVDCGNGVRAFGRDPLSSHQVWSSKGGYPGDVNYREYYRDIGHELDLDYIGPYILEDGTRINTGIKYYRITGENRPKEPYRPELAEEKAALQAEDFLATCRRRIVQQAERMEPPPIIVAPYDAELFGHWWFEGPLWLEALIRRNAGEGAPLAMATCSDYLDMGPKIQVVTPSASSWGEQGYHSFWLNEKNEWIYPHLHRAGKGMEELAEAFQDSPVDLLTERALKQAARSLLLAQASDWPFIMQSGTTLEYAVRRIKDHLARFYYLKESVQKERIDSRRLCALEIMDNIFPNIDYRCFIPKVEH